MAKRSGPPGKAWRELIAEHNLICIEELGLAAGKRPHKQDMRWRVNALELLQSFVWDARSLGWQELVYRHWFLVDRIMQRAYAQPQFDGEMDRAYWRTIEALLAEYKLDRYRMIHSDTQHLAHGCHLPHHVIDKLVDLAGFLGIGSLPRGITKQSRLPAGPPEVAAIGLAVAYRVACKPEGLHINGFHFAIDDPKPVATLIEWFKVSERTVQHWVAKCPPKVNFFQDIPIEHFVAETKKAGQRYQSFGRGVAQHTARARKRVGV